MALDETIGGSTSDTYITLAEADAYFDAHWLAAKTTTWETLSDPQKESVLKMATLIIDGCRFLDQDYGAPVGPLTALTLFIPTHYVVSRQFTGQKRTFPRNIDIDDAGAAFIPQEVLDAQCEQAIYMMAIDEAALINQLMGISEEAAGAGGVRIYQNFAGGRGSMLAPMANELLRRFYRFSNRRLLRG